MNSTNRDTPSPSTKRPRRRFSSEFKRDLVAQTMAPGASVSGIALANGINTNQLFAWRRQVMAATQAPAGPTLLPVHLDLGQPPAAAPAADAHVEISFAHATVRLHGVVDAGLVRQVLQCLAP
jgi:transposase